MRSRFIMIGSALVEALLSTANANADPAPVLGYKRNACGSAYLYAVVTSAAPSAPNGHALAVKLHEIRPGGDATGSSGADALTLVTALVKLENLKRGCGNYFRLDYESIDKREKDIMLGLSDLITKNDFVVLYGQVSSEIGFKVSIEGALYCRSIFEYRTRNGYAPFILRNDWMDQPDSP
jgi:hypothetical protein